MAELNRLRAAELFRRPPDAHLDVDGGQIAYRRVGAGPDVLFVHGWPVGGATFRGLLPHLAQHVTCHVIDLLGAGQSRFDRSTRIDLQRHIVSVGQVLERLSLEDIALVGHDSGGLIARHAMAGDPRLRAMGLIATEQHQGLTMRFAQLLALAKLPGFAHALSWAGMRPRLRRSDLLLGGCFTDSSMLDGEFEEFFLAPLVEDAERRWAAGQLARRFERRYVAELKQVHARIEVPVKLVWGERDPFFPVSWAREMVETFPAASLHVVPSAKLFVHEEFPAEVAEALLPTLVAERSAMKRVASL